MTEQARSMRPPRVPLPVAPGDPEPDPAPAPPVGGPVIGPRGCTYIRADGRPCGATRRRDVPFCWVHDAASAEKAVEARRLGGLRRKREQSLALAYDLPGVATPEEQLRIVEIAVHDTLAAPPSLERSRTLLTAVRTGQRIRREALLEARLRALEEAQLPRQPAAPPGSLLADAERFSGSSRR